MPDVQTSEKQNVNTELRSNQAGFNSADDLNVYVVHLANLVTICVIILSLIMTSS